MSTHEQNLLHTLLGYSHAFAYALDSGGFARAREADHEEADDRLACSAEELVRLLTEHTWTLCQGFEHDGLLWLNDSSGPDGAQEYAVFKSMLDENGKHAQVESITVSWSTKQRMINYVRNAPGWKPFAHYELKWHDEGSCGYCA